MILEPSPFNNNLHPMDKPSPTNVVKLLMSTLSAADELKELKKTNRRLSSFNARVLDLAPGESAAKLRAVDPTCMVDRLKSELPSMREQVRNATTPAVTNAKEHNKGSTYTIEVGDLLMPSGALYVVAVVTRLT